MKKWFQQGTYLAIGVFLSSTAFAGNASVAVNNLTDDPLNLHCQLSNTTRFYAYPNQQSHDFRMMRADADSIDIYEVTTDPASGPNLLCTNHQNLRDWFSYTIQGDAEKVEVSPDSHFHYDPSYPGSILFESH